MPLTRSALHEVWNKRPCALLAGLSAAAVLTIAGGIAVEGARSKALLVVGAASSAGAATLRERGGILRLEEENKRQQQVAEQEGQIIKDRILNVEQQVKQSTSKQLNAVERVLTELLNYRQIAKRIPSEANVQIAQSITVMGRQLLELEKAQEEVKRKAEKYEELLHKEEAEKAKHLVKITELERCLAEASVNNANNNAAAALQRTNSLHRYVESLGVEEAINWQRQLAEDVKAIKDKIPNGERQLLKLEKAQQKIKQSTSKQLDAIERVLTTPAELLHLAKDINNIKNKIFEEEKQLLKLEKAQEEAKRKVEKYEEFLYKAEVEKAKYLARIAELEEALKQQRQTTEETEKKYQSP